MSKIRDLENAINTFVAVSDTKNVSDAFENAKRELISEFESAKDDIEKLSKDDISIKVETHNDGIKVEVLEIPKLENAKKTEYTISFENNKRKIYIKIAKLSETFRGNEKFRYSTDDYDTPKNTFKQVYDSVKNEFCFFDKNTKVDVFESVIEMIAKDLLDMIKDKSKDNITII